MHLSGFEETPILHILTHNNGGKPFITRSVKVVKFLENDDTPWVDRVYSTSRQRPTSESNKCMNKHEDTRNRSYPIKYKTFRKSIWARKRHYMYSFWDGEVITEYRLRFLKYFQRACVVAIAVKKLLNLFKSRYFFRNRRRLWFYITFLINFLLSANFLKKIFL